MNDDWKSPEIREAEAALDEAMINAEQALAEADRVNAAIPESKLSEEQIEQVEQLVRAGKAPDEIKALQERIDEGDLSWNDIANGRGIDDEAVQKAFTAGVPNMQAAKELIDEGHGIDAIIEADPNRQTTGGFNDDDPPDSFMTTGKW